MNIIILFSQKSNKDKRYASRLAEKLKEIGYVLSLITSSNNNYDFDKRVTSFTEQIKKADVTLICTSPEGLNDKIFRREISIVKQIAQSDNVILLLVEKCYNDINHYVETKDISKIINGEQEPNAIAQILTLLRKIADKQAIASENINPPKQEQRKPSENAILVSPISGREEDWGDAMNVGAFYGRNELLSTLEKYVVENQCRIVALLGMGGIGKSSLAIKLAQKVKGDFAFLFWRDLRNSPPAERIIEDFLTFLSGKFNFNQPTNIDDQITLMLELINKSRCLIVLDNFEPLLVSGGTGGDYRRGYEKYGELLWRMGNTNHNSCLIITSREPPRELNRFIGQDTVRVKELDRLQQHEAISLLRGLGLGGTDNELDDLITRCTGNPFVLLQAYSTIQSHHNGNITGFLKVAPAFFGKVKELLDGQFSRLSELEREIMFWLAIERSPVSMEDLNQNFITPPTKRELYESLVDLKRRFLIETSTDRYLLQSLVIEYATELFIDLIPKEIADENINYLNRYALMKAVTKDYVRETQTLAILAPVADRLDYDFGKSLFLEKCRAILESLRKSGNRRGYAAGNLMNILSYMKAPLVGLDFSSLHIWQAYLQEVKLYNVNLGNSTLQNCVFTQTFGPIPILAFSPDGNYLAASEPTGTIHIWRISDFQLHITLHGHLNWVFALAFSPDGETLASGGEDKTVRLWDINSGKCIRLLKGHVNSVWAVAFSPDGQTLATGGEDETVRIWNAKDGECQATLEGHTRKVFSVAFSPDGNLLASSSADKSIKIWDVQSWKCINSLLGHTETVGRVDFSPDNQLLASSSWDKSIKIWDVKSGKCLNTLIGHTDNVLSVVFNFDNQILASSCNDGTIRIWDIQSGKPLKNLQRHTGQVWTLSFTRDGKKLASGGYDGTLRIWDTETWKCLNTLVGFNDWVQALDFSPDGQVIASSNADYTIRIWDIPSGECIKTYTGHNGWIFAVAFSPNGELFASGSDDQSIKIWDTRNWSLLKVLQGHGSWVQSVAFSPDGTRLASSADDRTVKIWDISTGLCIQTLLGHNEGIWSIDYRFDGKILASGSEDRTVKVWNLETGECIKTFEGHTDRIHSVAFSPDGKILASCGDDLTVRIWDFSSGECISILEGHTSWVISLAFNPNGNLIASGGKDQTVRIWDISNQKCIRVLHEHTGGVWSIAFNQNGKAIASASEDGTVRIWDIKNGQCLKNLRLPKPYEGVNITGVTGLTDAQRASLRILGAVEN